MDDIVPLYLDHPGDVEEDPEERDYGNRKFIHIGNNSPTAAPAVVKQEVSEVNRSPKVENSKLSSTFSRWISAHKEKTMPGAKSLNKQWIHPPDTLINSQVVYNVKFLGEVEVIEPKGTNIVKEAVRKMKFSHQIRKAEGEKLFKVDLVISVKGLVIQDPKTKVIKHQYPLHRISYCADEKTDSRVFTFIAKSGDTQRHFCYGFDSDKCSQEITLTVGQAFDLAYRKYLDNAGKDADRQKQLLSLEKKVNTLQHENNVLKSRICDLEQLKDKHEVYRYKQSNNIIDLTNIYNTNDNVMNQSNASNNTAVNALNNEILSSRSIVGRKLENLVYEEPSQASTASHVPKENNNLPVLSPPPSNTKTRSSPPQMSASNGVGSHPTSSTPDLDIFGAPKMVDAFGMEAFRPTPQDLEHAVKDGDEEFHEMQTGFSQGLSFGSDDFNLADLDPLSY